MATAPTSIKAWVIPTNGVDPYINNIPTTETPILGLTYPDGLKPENQKMLEEFKKAAADTHLIYDLPEVDQKGDQEGYQEGVHHGVNKGRYQPNVRLLPDTREYWGPEGWSERAAIEIDGHHLFYSRGIEEPQVFYLKVSDSADPEGKRFYVDVDSVVVKEKAEDLIDTITFFECHGLQTGKKNPILISSHSSLLWADAVR